MFTTTGEGKRRLKALSVMGKKKQAPEPCGRIPI